MKHYLKKAIRLSNHLSPGDTVCRSAQLSWRHPFYVIALLSLLPPGHPTCANEWQSAAVALIYCMAARTEPVCQRCIAALWHTNTCDAEPVCQERVPARCSVHSGWGGAEVFWTAPALPAALPSCPSGVIGAAANDKPCWGEQRLQPCSQFPQSRGGSGHYASFSIHLSSVKCCIC